MTDIKLFVEKYKSLAEEKLAWGKSEDWQTADFEMLSAEIFKKTGVLLSTSTLKRIWGKVKYDSTPNIATLDTLAQFVDFPNWRSFCNSQEGAKDLQNVKGRRYGVFMLVAGAFVAVILVGLSIYMVSKKTLRYSNIHFSSEPVTKGIPNTVIFNYDATDSNADSVFIQQSWDDRRRFRVDKYKHEYASTYYLPGYYRAKLVLNDSVVKEQDIFIESDWIGVFDKEPVPVYLPESFYRNGDWLGIKGDALNLSDGDYEKEVPDFVLTKVDRNMGVFSEDFELSVVLQNTFTGLRAPCRQAAVMLLGTDGVIRIPLSASGCVGDLMLRLGDQEVAGSTNNLSGFGVDFRQPVQLKCTVSAEEINISLDHSSVFKGKFIKGIGRIVGARITFEGAGVIKDFTLSGIEKAK